jgi:hypothetical protein
LKTLLASELFVHLAELSLALSARQVSTMETAPPTQASNKCSRLLVRITGNGAIIVAVWSNWTLAATTSRLSVFHHTLFLLNFVDALAAPSSATYVGENGKLAHVPNGMKSDCSPEQNRLWHASLFQQMLHYIEHGLQQLFKTLGIGIIAITNRGGMLGEDISAKSVVTRCDRISGSVSSAAFRLAIGVG